MDEDWSLGPLGSELDDPRLDERYVRVVDDGPAPVVLVGVVHDHPASVARVAMLVRMLSPAALALEVPNVSLPLYRRSATEDETAEDEMSAAIRAGDDAAIVGIDMPDVRSMLSLLGSLREERPSKETLAALTRDVGRLTRHALVGGLAGRGVPTGSLGDEFAWHREYDCSPADPPEVQASHERRHVRKSRALSRQLTPPATTSILDDVRERYMARRLDVLRRDGRERPVVAVVGYGHLDALASLLAAA